KHHRAQNVCAPKFIGDRLANLLSRKIDQTKSTKIDGLVQADQQIRPTNPTAAGSPNPQRRTSCWSPQSLAPASLHASASGSPHPFGCHEARRTRTHTEPPTTSPVAQTLPRRRPQNRPPPRAALHVYSPARRTHAVVAQRSRTRSSHSAPRMQSSHSVRAGRRPPARPSQRAEKRRAIRAPHRKSPRPETRRTQRRECLAPRRPLPSAHRAGRRPAFGQPVARSEARTTASPRRLTRGAPVHDLAFTRFSPALGQLEHGAELRVAADVPDAFVEPVVMQRKAPPDCQRELVDVDAVEVSAEPGLATRVNAGRARDADVEEHERHENTQRAARAIREPGG